jgi:hypothetical protein
MNFPIVNRKPGQITFAAMTSRNAGDVMAMIGLLVTPYRVY